MISPDYPIDAIKGKAFVVGDNVDTDQIIPAQYLNLVPTLPAEYRKLASYALCGLPEPHERFVKPGNDSSEYTIIVAGKNFGCGSSREHAPICLGGAGCKVILSQSYARIFFRNCIATGELFPVEYDSETDLEHRIKTGDEVTVNLKNNTITLSDGTLLPLRDPGDVRGVIQAGGIFNFARQTGIVSK